MNSCKIIAAFGLAAVGVVLGSTSASAGLVDGTLGNAHVIDHVSQLGTLVNGTAQTVSDGVTAVGDAAGRIAD